MMGQQQQLGRRLIEDTGPMNNHSQPARIILAMCPSVLDCPTTYVSNVTYLPSHLPAGKSFAVLGFGSSSYPRFCAAADLLHSMLLSLGASALLPVAKADALADEEGVVLPWLMGYAVKLQQRDMLDRSLVSALEQLLPTGDNSKVRGRVCRQ